MLDKRLFVALVLFAPSACSSNGDDDAQSSGGAGSGPTSGGSGNLAGAGGSGAGFAGASAAAAGAGSGNLAGTAGMGAVSSDDQLIVPAGLDVSALEGGTGSLELVALTIRNGPTNTEVYASLKNVGDMYACDAGLSVELYDKDQQSVTAGIGALLTQHIYERTDGSGTAAACVAPGETTMGVINDLPDGIAIDTLGYAVYHCTYFVLDVVPLAGGFSVDQVQSVEVISGTTYTGNFVNGLDVAVENPSVTIFPLNRVGRPLGAATATSTDQVPAGGNWAFQTSVVTTPGVDFAAYPSAAPSN